MVVGGRVWIRADAMDGLGNQAQKSPCSVPCQGALGSWRCTSADAQVQDMARCSPKICAWSHHQVRPGIQTWRSKSGLKHGPTKDTDTDVIWGDFLPNLLPFSAPGHICSCPVIRHWGAGPFAQEEWKKRPLLLVTTACTGTQIRIRIIWLSFHFMCHYAALTTRSHISSK